MGKYTLLYKSKCSRSHSEVSIHEPNLEEISDVKNYLKKEHPLNSTFEEADKWLNIPKCVSNSMRNIV